MFLTAFFLPLSLRLAFDHDGNLSVRCTLWLLFPLCGYFIINEQNWIEFIFCALWIPSEINGCWFTLLNTLSIGGNTAQLNMNIDSVPSDRRKAVGIHSIHTSYPLPHRRCSKSFPEGEPIESLFRTVISSSNGNRTPHTDLWPLTVIVKLQAIKHANLTIGNTKN